MKGGDTMALYIADGLEEGRLSYILVFSNPKNTKLKSTVDNMLIVDGFQDLIVEIPVA